VIALLCLLLPAWAQETPLTEQEWSIVRTLSPVPSPPPSPTNRWADSVAAARLGQRLFFDPALSATGKISCATCHDPQRGWTDGRTLARGIGTSDRNTPTLLGTAHLRWWFWDGRADSLWSQALHPIEAPREMGGSRVAVVRHIAETPGLLQAWTAAFGPFPELPDDLPRVGRPPPRSPSDPFAAPTDAQATDPVFGPWISMPGKDQKVVNGVFALVGKSLEAFQRRLVPGPSRFDGFVDAIGNGQSGSGLLAADELRGLRLFVGRAECVNCHFGPLLTDREFHNLGLAVADGQPFDDGRPDGIRKVRIDPFNGRGAHSDATGWEANQKLMFLGYDEHTYGAYKTPSLRNVELTGPYMHDGRFTSLGEAMLFYKNLPGQPPVGHREETLKQAQISGRDVADLAAFLRTLTGTPVPEDWARPPQSN